MRLLSSYSDTVNPRHVAEAVKALGDGGVIICPTDSMYALACDALNKKAVENLCRIKGLNPDKNLLSILCSSISMASEYARIDNNAFRTLKEYLPGPFTFILPSSTKLPKIFKGRKTVGVRVPDCAVAREIVTALGSPLLCSSVELDFDEFTTLEAALETLPYISSIDIAVDCGADMQAPSTIVDLSDSLAPEIIRQGKGEFLD